MIHYDVRQNSDDWLMLRIGVPTASEFHKIVTPKTLKLSEQSATYMHYLLAEWIFNGPLDTPETDWMIRGRELEDEAVKSYAFEMDCEPEPAGFFMTDDGMAGASPDRIVPARNRLLEIKCPSPQVHVGYMLTRAVDEKYMTQLQGQLWVSGYAGVDIQSYCPGFPTVIIPVERDEKYVGVLSVAVRQFIDRLLEARAALQQQYGDFRPKPKPRVEDPLGITDEDIAAIYGKGAGS